MGKHLGTQKSIRFSADELALLEQMAEKHGTIKGAVMAGLYALDEGTNTAIPAAVAAELEKMAKQIRDGLK